MAVVFNWMLDRADDSTIVAATDARNPKIRYHLLTTVFNHQTDEEQHLDNYIMYKAMPSKADIRFPRRKVYGALSNVETVVGVLPVSRVRMKTRQRENFSACGETCTHTRTYSGVSWRGLADLPRMQLNVKEGLTGVTLPTYDDAVSKECKTKGHPLHWKETLDMEWYIAFFQDSHATHVFDVTPGSGAAACAAAVLDISYEGVAMSAKHAAWLDNIMDKAIFAVMRIRDIQRADSGAMIKSDLEAKELQENVLEHFKDLIEEGRKYVELVDNGDEIDHIEEDVEY